MKKVYVVDGARTPFLKAKGRLGPFSGADLAVGCARALLARQKFSPTAFDEVIVGAAMPSADEANIGRVVALRVGCGDKVPAWTVMRNCASGMQALDSAYVNILAGKSHLVLAGGTDAMSHAPLLFGPAMVNWLADWYAAKSFGQRASVATKFRLSYLVPVIAILKGLTDPIVKLSMGATAEIVAKRFGITREMMDAFAAESHQRVLAGRAAGHFSEIEPLIDAKGIVYREDDGVRTDSTKERLAKLRPVFDKTYGNVTAGNASQVTDGAAMLILASEEAVAKYDLTPLGAIVDSQWSGLDPAEMGLGPVHAITPMLLRNGLGLKDLDCLEINEAFAAQALGCLAAWESEAYCKEKLGLSGAFGTVDRAKFNVDGGAIAIGHPIGASGARVVLHALKTLERTGGKRAAASLCIGGGQGGAMLLERP
ncbi:MAG: acetyl-CoA C-acetyltransferase [Burkholderiales bacterium]|jgi:acetyl-CoA C-acetyltransferase|nr:acetyl-CoA C-acetyltransferase [Rhodocyclaceae bacterium]MCA3022464.1 acetyl-CoA C-acetyltransferase [Rhodocyclaceae bacterium]MCA3042302.1 acetyl-CoA C-acetyltransferase [Rhodocyclaceae bacterium]MCA3053308.1 acetyl-CoA C-acetyltransferase [Rhodocyclaceae bacterium]MCA3056871.1 acetyl-CoA C-acetyltransferase [Rhodocyclaceae bacterium]